MIFLKYLNSQFVKAVVDYNIHYFEFVRNLPNSRVADFKENLRGKIFKKGKNEKHENDDK